MKLKGYIEVTVVTAGLEAIEVKQQLRVENIDVVMDARAFNASDRGLAGIEGQTQTIIVMKQVSDSPCEVTETYEQVIALMKEASE